MISDITEQLTMQNLIKGLGEVHVDYIYCPTLINFLITSKNTNTFVTRSPHRQSYADDPFIPVFPNACLSYPIIPCCNIPAQILGMLIIYMDENSVAI